MRIGRQLLQTALMTIALCPLVLSAQTAEPGAAASPDDTVPPDEKGPRYQYPTQARVEWVLGCMSTLGGINYTNLYKCTCAIDEIANVATYKQFVYMDTFERGRSAGGERLEILRETQQALDARAAYAEILGKAADRCIIENPDFVPETRGGDDEEEGEEKARPENDAE